jgi:hypothetical protein
LSGVGVLEDSVDNLGAIALVGAEHIRKRGKAGGIAGTASDIDGSTVHVQLGSTAGHGVPGPGESALAVGDLFGESEIENLGASVKTRAATLDGLDDLEDRVRGGLQVRSVGQLAGTTTVDGGTLEADLLGLSHSHGVHLSDSEAILDLAGELCGGDGRVIDLIVAVRDRRLHDDVGIGGGSQERSDGEKCGFEGRHFDSGVVIGQRCILLKECDLEKVEELLAQLDRRKNCKEGM